MGQSQHKQYNITGGYINTNATSPPIFINGYFRIRSYVNNQALSYKGNNPSVILETPSDKYNQQWFMDKYGRIINRFNAMDLIVTGNNNGAVVILKKMASDLTAQWRIDKTGSIISKYNEYLLTFDDNGKIPYVYTWEAFEGNSQKWYFEVMDDQQWTTKIVKGIKTGPIDIPNLMMRPAVNFSYYGWANINMNNKAVISLTKGNQQLNLNINTASLINGKFQIETDTGIVSCNIQTKLDSNANWLHLGLVVSGQTINVYINAKLVKTCDFTDLITLNTNPLSMQGQFRNFNYSNFAVSYNTILTDYHKLYPKLHAPVKLKKSTEKPIISEQISKPNVNISGLSQELIKQQHELSNKLDKLTKNINTQKHHKEKQSIKEPVDNTITKPSNTTYHFSLINQTLPSMQEATATNVNSSLTSLKSLLPSKSSIISAVTPISTLLPEHIPDMNMNMNTSTYVPTIKKGTYLKFQLHTNGQRDKCKTNTDTTAYWCAKAPDQQYYFELDLLNVYNLDSITTSKYSSTEWIRTYKLIYLDSTTLKWMKYDILTLGTEHLSLKTQKLRIYPLTWNNWPSVKIKVSGIAINNNLTSINNNVVQQETMSMVLTSLYEIQTQLNALNESKKQGNTNNTANLTYLNELNNIQQKYENCRARFT